MEPVPLTLYKNGIVMFQGPFRPFTDPSTMVQGQLIDTAYAVGVIKPDVKQFSHALREFRNYIHPSLRVEQDFTPDEHTAGMCFLAVKAALADLSGER